MQGQVLATVESAVAQFGFLTAADVDLLARDSTAGSLKCIIRAHEGRKVVPLRAVPLTVTSMERDGWHVRDVALTADECDRLRQHG